MGCQSSKTASAAVLAHDTAIAPEATIVEVLKVMDEASTATPSIEHDSEDSETIVISSHEDGVITNDLSDLFAEIDTRFAKLDADGHCILRRDDLQTLTDWVFKNCHPGGEGLSARELMKVSEGLLKECSRHGGALTCPGFIEWLERTCEDIKRVRKVVAWRNHSAQFDGPVRHVFDVQVTEVELSAATNGNFRSSRKLSPAAQAALQRYNEGWFGRCCHC